MFTGIVERLGTVDEVARSRGTIRLNVRVDELLDEISVGDSVCVNGVCLTVVDLGSSTVSFEAIPETLAKSNLGDLKRGDKINIERSLKLSDRLGGHLVLGHVDGVGKICRSHKEEGMRKIWISVTPDLLKGMIRKGSVALDGVSLTIVDIEQDSFSVCLIPHTISATTLGFKRNGDTVNVEVDMIGKWVRKIVEELPLSNKTGEAQMKC